MTQENAAEFYKITSGTDKTKNKLCIWYFPGHDKQGNDQAVGSEQTGKKLSQSDVFVCDSLWGEDVNRFRKKLGKFREEDPSGAVDTADQLNSTTQKVLYDSFMDVE